MNSQNLKKLEQQVLQALSILKNKTTILALSGGADSVFLLHFLKQIPTKKLITAHVNHNLRGKKSDQDQQFCQQISQNLTHENTSINLPQTNTEALAREARYQFFTELSQKHQASYLLTAHHAEDNLETILLNLTRGASLQGLSGIQPLTQLTPQTTLFRPLLQISKTEILDYLKTKKIPYHQDQTNFDQKYTRNKIRHSIIPTLQEINPNIAKTIAKNTPHLQEIQHYLQQQAQQFITNQYPQLNAKTFRQQPQALQTEILLSLHQKITGHRKNVTTSQIQETLSIIHNNIGNKHKKLGKITIHLKDNLITTSPSPRD